MLVPRFQRQSWQEFKVPRPKLQTSITTQMASKRSECQLSNWSVSVTSQNNDVGSFHAPPQRISNFDSSNGLGFRMRLTHYNNGLYLYHHIYGHIPLGDMVSSCSPLHGGVCMQLLSICLSIYLYIYFIYLLTYFFTYIHVTYIYIYTYILFTFFSFSTAKSHGSSLPSKSVLHSCLHNAL